MILREGQGALEIEATIKRLGHDNAKSTHILRPSPREQRGVRSRRGRNAKSAVT
jgi:hypothetical protein